MKKVIPHHSFKSAKCKTSLKMAASRIKLMKNKKEAQVKQIKRELAQLLESGQDQTARIRVEHVVREEKMLAAYELIEIYCELIVARLPIIESQKNCPIDLKEAICSVIFASPRCADIPELMDTRKQFMAKYGKEFVSAAVELRPNCGVSRLLVEKLSAKAPDGPTKIKILTAIAEEHNVKWEPKSFGEIDTKPPEDLLKGPSTFVQATKLHAEHPAVQEPPNNFDKGSQTIRVPQNHNEEYYDPSSGSSSHLQNLPSKNIGNNAMPTGTSHSDPRSPGTGDGGTEFRRSYNGDKGGFSMGRPSWNMEFKDATAAAQAAAESAERASMAARAAAELSSQGRISRQHSTDSRKSFASGSRDEECQNHTGTKMQGEHLAKGPLTNDFDEQNYGMHHDLSNADEQDDLAGLAERFKNLKNSNRSSRSASSKSSSASVDDYLSVRDKEVEDRHSRKISSELENDFFGEGSVKGESSESEVDFEGEVQDGMKSETIGRSEEINMKKESSSVSSCSHPQTDHHYEVPNFDRQKSGGAVFEDPFNVEEKNDRNAYVTPSYDNPTAVFDDSGSEHEYNFDMETTSSGQESSSFFSSEGRKSSSHLLANTNAQSPRQSIGEPVRKSSAQSIFAPDQLSTSPISEDLRKDKVPSLSDGLLPATFDDSDSPSSESEEEPSKSKLVQGASAGVFPPVERFNSRKSELTQNENLRLIGSSGAENENVGSSHTKGNQETKYGAKTDGELGYSDLHAKQSSPGLGMSRTNSNASSDKFQRAGLSSVNIQAKKSQDIIEDDTTLDESNLDGGKELNFGTLIGGLRNRGYRHPPFRRNSSNNSLSSKQAAVDTSTQAEQLSSPSKVVIGSEANGQEPKSQILQPKMHKNTGSRASVTYFDSSDDDSDEEQPPRTISSNQEPHDKKVYIDVNKKSSPRTYFDAANSDSEQDFPKQASTGKGHSATGYSRRTKGSTSSGRNSYSKATVLSESSMNPDNEIERKSSLRSSGGTETQPKVVPQAKSSDYRKSSEPHRQTASKPIPQPQRFSHEESSTSSYATEARQNLQSQSKKSDYGGSSEHRRSSKGLVYSPTAESRRSSREESLKSSATEQPSNPPPKTVTSGIAESSKTSSSIGERPLRENSISKASHVHPKLPDYDTFTAHLLSLRQNRQ